MKLKELVFFRTTQPVVRPEGDDARDMLRYDIAFVRDDDPSLIVFPVWSTKTGNLGMGEPSARWMMRFGVRFTPLAMWSPGAGPRRQSTSPVTDTDVATWVEEFKSGRGWYRYLHPIDDGRKDYSKLIRVSLADYLQQHVDPAGGGR